jgi:hypothetical protein
MDTNKITTDPQQMYDYMTKTMFNPMVFAIVFVIIVAYFVFFYYLGKSDTSTSVDGDSGDGSKTRTVTIVVIGILIVLFLLNILQYLLNINITAYIKDLFTSQPKIDITIDKTTTSQSSVPLIRFKKQVFNIPGNYYNYDNAKALCNAYGAKLATYKQVEDAYKNGAEWCNYGWSDGQMALFPTQQKTFDGLQKIAGHENDCGRPGINGGYMANPEIMFGVNCYGNKPKMTPEEEELMKTSTPYPQTMEDIVFQKQVDYWKGKIDEILVSPFNYSSWGAI